MKFQVILCRPLFNFAIHQLYPEDMHTSLQCLALWGKYLEPRVLHPNESMYSISATYHRLEYIASFYAVQHLGSNGLLYSLHKFGSKLYMLEHGLRTPRESLEHPVAG